MRVQSGFRRLQWGVALSVAALAFSNLAMAQAWPSRPITFSIPFASGSNVEVLMRAMSVEERMAEQSKKELRDIVIVDVPDPSTSQINRFYTAEFLGEARRQQSRNDIGVSARRKRHHHAHRFVRPRGLRRRDGRKRCEQ